MAEKTEAPKAGVTLESLQFNEENKLMAGLSTLGIIGGIIGLVEDKDMFVKYHGLQFGALALIIFIAGIIPLVNILSIILGPLYLVVWVMGLVKVLKGERFDIPVISGLVIDYMNK